MQFAFKNPAPGIRRTPAEARRTFRRACSQRARNRSAAALCSETEKKLYEGVRPSRTWVTPVDYLETEDSELWWIVESW